MRYLRKKLLKGIFVHKYIYIYISCDKKNGLFSHSIKYFYIIYERNYPYLGSSRMKETMRQYF